MHSQGLPQKATVTLHSSDVKRKGALGIQKTPFQNRKKGGFEIMKNFKKVISTVVFTVNRGIITYTKMFDFWNIR